MVKYNNMIAEFWNIKDVDHAIKQEQTIILRLLCKVYGSYK